MSRINTNVTSLNAQRNISQTNQAFGRTVGRLSSGFRINRAADDAAGLGIANKLRSDIRALKQASSNATQANSLLQVAEGATNQISNIVDRMKELASQSASDSVNNDGRALIQAEFSQLQDEITRIVDTTKFQGTELLSGGTGDPLQFMVSVSGNAAGDGQDFISLDVQDLTLTALGLDASSLASRDDAVEAIGALDEAIGKISAALGDIGAAQNRLDFAQANVATTIENFSAAESVIRDADFAAEASEFARLQILQQSQIAMLAQANAAPQGVLQLIG
ncbi:MAG: flagellin FliC [Gemmatimonadales bacterium]|nr:MAG: flagellin FliC [Gemmatimonadales bacterium]